MDIAPLFLIGLVLTHLISRRAPEPAPARSALFTSLLLLVTACGDGERHEEVTVDVSEDTAAVVPIASPALSSGGATSAADSLAPEMVALGDSIYHGRAAGGTCFTCHGQAGQGTEIGPSLADPQWLHGDGSYNGILALVIVGVPTPLQYPAPMPRMGGVQLTMDQARAVAAYVYSLSREGA